MPHPILKKTRGPSMGGPRPTARFISPPESDGEADHSSSVSTNSQTNSHVVVEPPSPDSQNVKFDKKSSPSGKKKRRLCCFWQEKAPCDCQTSKLPNITVVVRNSPNDCYSSVVLGKDSAEYLGRSTTIPVPRKLHPFPRSIQVT